MAKHRSLKLVHITSTAWFIVCMGYIFVLALRQAGVNWWIVLSLSGHGTLIALILISLYLFAIFRGISSSQKVHLEHPLTSTGYYQVFYVITPLLGGLAGCLGMIGVRTITQFTMGIALGTLGMTFLVWVIVDPLVGLLEMLLPAASRRHRAERLAESKAERERRQKKRERLLKEVLAKAESQRLHWQKLLKPQAEELATLLTANTVDFKQLECEAVSIGVKAWQIGGLSCMRELRDMAVAIAKEKSRKDSSVVDYIGVWWDGIGKWRKPSLV
jgi:hypothetical protein